MIATRTDFKRTKEKTVNNNDSPPRTTCHCCQPDPFHARFPVVSYLITMITTNGIAYQNGGFTGISGPSRKLERGSCFRTFARVPYECVPTAHVRRPRSKRNHVPDERATEKSQNQTHHGADGKHGERSQVQRVPWTFGRQTRADTLRSVDRPERRVQGAEEDTKRERQTVQRAHVAIRFGRPVGLLILIICEKNVENL